MIFTEADFAEMKYPVHTTPNAELFQRIPLFKEIISECSVLTSDRKWKAFITAEQIMKYMAYVYHRKSPLAERMADIVARKKTALELCGINLKEADANFEAKKFFFSIIMSQSEFANYLSLTFLKFENNLKWLQLCRAMEAWEDAQFQMQQESEGTERKSAVDIAQIKTKLYQGAQKYLQDINKLSAELMQEDAMLANSVQSYLFVEKSRKRLVTPEDYASLTMDERIEEFRLRGYNVGNN